MWYDIIFYYLLFFMSSSYGFQKYGEFRNNATTSSVEANWAYCKKQKNCSLKHNLNMKEWVKKQNSFLCFPLPNKRKLFSCSFMSLKMQMLQKLEKKLKIVRHLNFFRCLLFAKILHTTVNTSMCNIVHNCRDLDFQVNVYICSFS